MTADRTAGSAAVCKVMMDFQNIHTHPMKGFFCRRGRISRELTSCQAV